LVIKQQLKKEDWDVAVGTSLAHAWKRRHKIIHKKFRRRKRKKMIAEKIGCHWKAIQMS